jgi:hypothetical protein
VNQFLSSEALGKSGNQLVNRLVSESVKKLVTIIKGPEIKYLFIRIINF